VKIFRRIIRHALYKKTPSYGDTLKLNDELQETHADVPPSLRMRAISSSFADQVHMILDRGYIDILPLKIFCVLYRNYMSHDRSNPAFEHSRKTCTDAALQILKYQAELHLTSQPGGQFYNDKWILSSLTLHDFLMTAKIICLDLYESHADNTRTEYSKAQVEKYDALRVSRDIWTSRTAFSRDARRASNVLAVMLSKVKSRYSVCRSECTSSDVERVAYLNGGTRSDDPATESPSWGTAAFDVPGQEFPADDFSSLDFNSADPLATIFEFDNIDWVSLEGPTQLASQTDIHAGLVDQYLLGRSGVDDSQLE
jgi:hypothetical protein